MATTHVMSPAQPLTDEVAVDVRDRPLEDLRLAYEERWRLVADDRADHPTSQALARNAARIADLERRCRPAGRVLPRRTGPDPSTFLG
ncbi:hypothetical protein [Kineococcus sp. SYSU DK001]|uniref:hypothetical protein n=1 Tax=Kineococcus sp. SYSU DK001 TaxID=3383122 RepID=UPI003D7EA7FC